MGSEVGVVTGVTSEITGASVFSSSSLAQEKMMRLKRKRESIMSLCFTWFPISGLG